MSLPDLARHPAEVAPDLLGCTLACRGTAAVITEVEAYHQEEPAAHSWGGRPTPRSEGLFGPPGTAYVYRSYGIHWCANVVTGPAGSGEAVLFRSAVAIHGEALMRTRRAAARGVDPASIAPRDLLGGPGRLGQALDLRGEDTGWSMVRSDVGTVEEAIAHSADGPVLVRDVAAAARAGIVLPVEGDRLLVGPRIGISKAVDLPWRFGVHGAGLSRPFPQAGATRRG